MDSVGLHLQGMSKPLNKGTMMVSVGLHLQGMSKPLNKGTMMDLVGLKHTLGQEGKRRRANLD